MSELKLETGVLLELVDTKDLDIGYPEGAQGVANFITEIEGNEYVAFMPAGDMKTYIINSSRVKVIGDTVAGEDFMLNSLKETAND